MKTTRVQGRGELTLQPDILVLGFGIKVMEKEYADCVAELNRRTQFLREDLGRVDIPAEDLKTSRYEINLDQEYKSGRYRFIGYEANHRMKLELPMDKELLNRVFGVVVQGSSHAEINIGFTIEDKPAAKKTILANAMRDAEETARTLAEASGKALGELQSVDYGWTEIRMYEEPIEMCLTDAMAAAPPAPDIEAEDLRIREAVTAVYEILEK